jgi:hypothetical protein
MAGNPTIVVRIASNVREFLKGTDQVERALDDLGDESGDLSLDVERDTRRMEDAFRDAAASIDKSSRKAERSVREGFADPAVESGKEAGSEVGAEFASNLGESLASSDLSGLGRDTAAGLVSGFASIGGPIGLVLAGVAATAAGVFAGITSAAEASKERIDELYQSLIGGDALASESLKESQALAYLDSLGSSADQVLDAYEAIGVSLPDVVAALAGDEGARQRIAEATDKATDSLFAQEDAATKAGDALTIGATSVDLFATATGDGITKTEEATVSILSNRDAYAKLAAAIDEANVKAERYYRLTGNARPIQVNAQGVPVSIARPGGGQRSP